MVRQEDNYSFRLSPIGSDYSDCGTVSSSYKRRIDSLFSEKIPNPFADKRENSPEKFSPFSRINPEKFELLPKNEEDTPVKTFVTKAHIHSEKCRSPMVSSSPVNCVVTCPLKTSIKIPPPQVWESKAQTPREELEKIFGGKDQRQQAFHDVRSAVQAQIERLFSDASTDQINNSKQNLSKIIIHNTQSFLPPPPNLPLPPIPSPSPPLQRLPEKRIDISDKDEGLDTQSSSSDRSSPRPVLTSMKYRIHYLGALSLNESTSSLEVLQEPLKELYYKYRLSISKNRNPLPGSLQITDSGIRIAHGSRELPGYFEMLNPFQTIAVWAAVKLVIRREVGEHGQMFLSYAFLPLICDPEANDKYNLYNELNVGNPNVMAGEHPPMFACVMRKLGSPTILECHGFVCASSEDAIVIAANLYQALLETMRNGGNFSSDSSDTKDSRIVMSDSEIVPKRPPRRKRNKETYQNLDKNLKRSTSDEILRTQFNRNENRISKRRIKRSISDRHSLTSLSDIELYTKVPIPRSKSFINVTNKDDFQDLLKDVKNKTGLNSVDDVLKQVINPHGMSFTEMDPSYRELLLKLALTLSKDEIYQRSKNIMKKQKGRTSVSPVLDSDSESSTISSVLRATKRSFSRLGSRASSFHTSHFKEKPLRNKLTTGNRQLQETYEWKKEKSNTLDSLSSVKNAKISSCPEHNKPFPKTPMPKRTRGRSSDGYGSCSECGYDSECSSKCYCSLPRKHTSHKIVKERNNNCININNTCGRKPCLDSSCDCDTESCAESEKCYCSLKGVKTNGIKMYEINLDSDTSECTTKSHCTATRCASVETNGSKKKSASPYLTENSKSRSAGTVFSIHPDNIRKKSLSLTLSSESDNSEGFSTLKSSIISTNYYDQENKKRNYRKQRSASSEFLTDLSKSWQRPSNSLGSRGTCSSRCSSASNLSNCHSHKSRKSNDSLQKVLLVSAVDPNGKVVYRGASKKQNTDGSDTNSIMSMKKTAEIAALFTELKLNQTTDIVNQLQSTSESEDDAYSSMQANSSFLFSDNIENSLGYLP